MSTRAHGTINLRDRPTPETDALIAAHAAISSRLVGTLGIVPMPHAITQVRELIAISERLERLRDALRERLQWYADKQHLSGPDWDDWDSVSGEPENWLCPPTDEAMMVEDGGMARLTLTEIDKDKQQ